MWDELWRREAPPHLSQPRKVNESPELHLVSSMEWYAIEDQASAIRVEPKPDGAIIQFRINGIFQNKCEIVESMLKLLMHRFTLMVPPDNIMRIVINDNRYNLGLTKEPTNFGERVTMEITYAGIYRDWTNDWDEIIQRIEQIE
ncbi:MAG TPA: hypothetical protein VM821_05800 [Abditibacteriaceae bacterium]|nr:hypothetical protein [Abditibacteriaceae bacterium]